MHWFTPGTRFHRGPGFGVSERCTAESGLSFLIRATMIRFICIFLLPLSLLLRASSAAGAPIPEEIEFNRDVRPVLANTCFLCHGPDKNSRKAKMRLDIRDEALKPAK